MSYDPSSDFDLALDRIGEILLDQQPHEHGFLLAELLARWLAAHRSTDAAISNEAAREEMLRRHVAAVRKLLPLIAAQIDAKRRAH